MDQIDSPQFEASNQLALTVSAVLYGLALTALALAFSRLTQGAERREAACYACFAFYVAFVHALQALDNYNLREVLPDSGVWIWAAPALLALAAAIVAGSALLKVAARPQDKPPPQT